MLRARSTDCSDRVAGGGVASYMDAAPPPEELIVTRQPTKPDQLQDMQQLRAAIDALDVELVGKLAERAALIDRAIAIKTQNGLPARIDARVEEVVQNVCASANALAFDADLVESLWRRIINWSIAREEAVLGAGPQQD